MKFPRRDKIARCARHFRLLDKVLADHRFLCRDVLSLADVPAGTSLYRYFELEIERPSLPKVFTAPTVMTEGSLPGE